MTFCIITHVPHGRASGQYFAYAPYVNEMNVWMKHVDQVHIVAPFGLTAKQPIHASYVHSRLQFTAVPGFHLLGIKAKIRSLFYLPKIFFTVFNAMGKADHIHLRCPGNM